MKKNWSTLMRCSRRAIALGWLLVELWCFYAVVSPRVIDLVSCKVLFSNKYYILWHWLFCIHFLYGMYVNLILDHTYYEYSVWFLQLGITEWYQSDVDRRNASLVRRVMFSRLFYKQNYFCFPPLQNIKSAPYRSCYLALFSTSILVMQPFFSFYLSFQYFF
jgi:hypothetical protein